VVVEGLLALYFAGCVIYAVAAGMWASVPFLALFLHGYAYIFLLSVAPLLHAPPGARRRRMPLTPEA